MRSKLGIVLFVLGLLFVLVGVSSLLQNYSTEKTQNSAINNSISKPVNASASASLAPSQIKNLKKALVSEVFDGDTIKLSNGEIVRYLGINSPEKEDPLYTQAKNKNSTLVLNKTVSLEPDITRKDRYGRFLYYVYVGNIFVNLEMVKEGLAVSQTLPPDVKYQDEIVNAQKLSREGCVGIWEGLCKNGIDTCIKISNINYNAKGNDNTNKNGEWIEFTNTCSQNVSMKSWILKDSSASNRYEFKNFVLNSEKTVDLYSGCGQDSPDKLYWSCPEQKYAVWNNSGDHAYLYDEKGELISDYQY